jgi:nucleotide-binding universal stress UspA family protein
MTQKKTNFADKKIEEILWATDFSKESRFSLPYVKYFANNLKTENHAMYVLPKFSDWIYETAFLSDDELFNTIAKTRQKAMTKMTGYSKKAQITFKAQVMEGIASAEILKYSKEKNIDLIFAGRRGISEIEHILIGSTTSRLIRNSEIPVFIAPKQKRDVKMNNVLCPIDFSDFSIRELDYAISLAKQLNAKLSVIHVSEFFNYRVPVFKRDILVNKINSKINNIAVQHDYSIENIIYDEGEPAQKIMEIAKKRKMDVITMATHQRKGFEKFFLGSITEKVLMYSDIPVIVLPPPHE